MVNAKCAICNRDYEVCNSCSDQKKIRPWRSIVDTIEHYKIYLAIHEYTVSKNKENAKQALQSCNLLEIETFNPEIKFVINEIMSEPPKVKTGSRSKKVNANNISMAEQTQEDEFNE